jgi:hypothetical protein
MKYRFGEHIAIFIIMRYQNTILRKSNSYRLFVVLLMNALDDIYILV